MAAHACAGQRRGGAHIQRPDKTLLYGEALGAEQHDLSGKERNFQMRPRLTDPLHRIPGHQRIVLQNISPDPGKIRTGPAGSIADLQEITNQVTHI
jgi:hypothetical protein